MAPNGFDVEGTQAALNLLGSNLGEADFRVAFKENPKEASANAGVEVERLPDALFDTLGEMSFEELEMVSRIQGMFVEMDPPPGWVKVAIFF